MKLKRLMDGWEFKGEFSDYSPIRPRNKIVELTTIKGVSRYQSFGQAGAMAKFTLMFIVASDFCEFISLMDLVFEFTDEFGKVYQGVFKEEVPEVGKIGVGGRDGVYNISLQFFSSDIPGVGR